MRATSLGSVVKVVHHCLVSCEPSTLYLWCLLCSVWFLVNFLQSWFLKWRDSAKMHQLNNSHKHTPLIGSCNITKRVLWNKEDQQHSASQFKSQNSGRRPVLKMPSQHQSYTQPRLSKPPQQSVTQRLPQLTKISSQMPPQSDANLTHHQYLALQSQSNSSGASSPARTSADWLPNAIGDPFPKIAQNQSTHVQGIYSSPKPLEEVQWGENGNTSLPPSRTQSTARLESPVAPSTPPEVRQVRHVSTECCSLYS